MESNDYGMPTWTLVLLIIIIAVITAVGVYYIFKWQNEKRKMAINGLYDFNLKFRLSFPVKEKMYSESVDVEMIVPGDNRKHAVENLNRYIIEEAKIIFYNPDNMKIEFPLLRQIPNDEE